MGILPLADELAEVFALIESPTARQAIYRIMEAEAFIESVVSLPQASGTGHVTRGKPSSREPGDIQAAARLRWLEKRLNDLAIDCHNTEARMMGRIDKEISRELPETRTTRHLRRKYTVMGGK